MYFAGLVAQTSTGSSINLQATLSAATAMGEPCLPHHPITCQGDLLLHEDGAMECGHARTSAGDTRVQACLDATAAILLFELVHEKYGTTPRTS